MPKPQRNKTNTLAFAHIDHRAQIRPGVRPVRSESSVYACLLAKVPSILYADINESDQTVRMSMLI